MPKGKPRSVPDPAGEQYELMMRQERLKRKRADAAARKSPDDSAGQTQKWLDQSATLKAIGGYTARRAGNLVGVARGGWHAVEGLTEGVSFLSRLVDPFDKLTSPPGEAAIDQVVGAGKGVFDYARNGLAHPESVARDIKNKAHQAYVSLDPGATPVATRFPDELRRNFEIGKNQGELAFDVGSLVVGGPFAKEVGAIADAQKAATASKYLSQGFSPGVSAYLAEPYKGMGHHFGPRRANLPPAYSESVFNVLKPEGISRGDFYERHFLVDPHFYAARLPKRLGGGSWRGKALDLEKHGPIGQIWYGSPGPLKARVLGLSAGALGTAKSSAIKERPQ
ncbi:MAG: hypothetical protein CGW95_06325 [Phenylobacterium zucineum]|nr:MAG: hypothetical protein CGW95_06325 [Phenylobacterium zucineum]